MSKVSFEEKQGTILLEGFRKRSHLRLFWQNEQKPTKIMGFWLVAFLLGTASGLGAVGFRFGIEFLQTQFYGAFEPQLHSEAARLPPWLIFIIPVIGGLVVGLILYYFTPDNRARAVADIVHGAASQNGRVEKKSAISSTFASLITLSTGGSSGREGPVVYMAGAMASYVADWINANGEMGRKLLACAVAGAVSASFNAPLAGMIFALEIVLRHLALNALAPIAIASVAGAIVSRLFRGDVTEFILPDPSLKFYAELPAFLLLGVVSALVATLLMRSIFFADRIGNKLQAKTHLPPYLRPMIAGGFLGLIAIYYPHIIGPGYETLSRTLTGQLDLSTAIIFALVKALAVSITFGGRMAGGVFSPSLMLGAFSGLAFGYIATSFLPTISGSEILYALAGMGAVAAAVLGAPISTIVIVIEMTGDWQAGIAVMLTTSVAITLSSGMVNKSFFLTQLEQKGVRLSEGRYSYLQQIIKVGRIMRIRGSDASAPDGKSWELIEAGVWLPPEADLSEAFALFESSHVEFIPIGRIQEEGALPDLLGAVYYVDALRAYNRELVSNAKEHYS